MKKLLLTNLILLILLSICGCSGGTDMASNDDKVFQAIAEVASQNSSNAGNTNRIFFDQRFKSYYEVVDTLENSNIITSAEVTRFKEAGEANKQNLQEYLTDPSKKQDMSNYITSNCSWCLGADTLMQMIHFLSYINTSIVAANNNIAKGRFYSMPGTGMTNSNWFIISDPSNFNEGVDPTEHRFNYSVKNANMTKIQNAIDKIYAIVTNTKVLNAVSGTNGGITVSISNWNDNNTYYDLHTEINSSSTFTIDFKTPRNQEGKMSSIYTSQESSGDLGGDETNAIEQAKEKIKTIIPKFTENGRYAIMTYATKEFKHNDPTTGEPLESTYGYIINLYVAPTLKIDGWNKLTAEQSVINYSMTSSRLIGINDPQGTNDTANYIGLSTLTSSNTSGQGADSIVNSKIYVFNPTSANMDKIDTFLGFLKKYENASGKNQEKAGDEVYKYLKDTYEVLQGNGGEMFKCSKGDTSLTNIDTLISNIVNNVSLSSYNKPSQIGKDFIYDYDDIPLFSLRLFEIRPDADQKIDKMRNNKKLEGYMTINTTKNGSVQFRTWQRLDIINKITTTGVDVIHSDLIYDFKEQLWYKVVVNAGGSGISFDYEGLNNIPDSQIQFDAPGDNLNNDERKLIFTRENFSNQDVPYFDINKTVMSGTEPGHLLLLEYRCLYDITDSKMVQENQDRKLTDKAWLPIGRRVYFNADNITVQDGENGESVYRWVKAKTPVAYLSDPISGRINTDYPLFCDSFTDITHSQKLNTIIDLENESATYNNGNYQNTGGLNIIADNQDLIRYTANGQ